MYTCKEMRDIVKNRLRYSPRKENIQDRDYFDLIKRGVKRLHRIVVNINNSFYKKVHAQYIIHSDPTDVVAFPADLYKVISWKSHPTAAIGNGVISSTHYGESISWTEIDNGSNRGLMQLERAKDVDSAQDIEGSLMYVREPDMPTTWASTPDIPDGYDDWLIQYVFCECMIQIGNPQYDMAKLKELDQMVLQSSRREGAAGQTAAS